MAGSKLKQWLRKGGIKASDVTIVGRGSIILSNDALNAAQKKYAKSHRAAPGRQEAPPKDRELEHS
ncbi:hypothetical protein [Halotalea alkalilenta]|uniref:hypothetical protein n=1 Tax=Halotalea alkalilenta TaxID=376489 RepID=UPI0012DCAB4A|nr:hypothetical protein [Halotalea alkalilenta]